MKYRAIFFDWDGTAVEARKAPIDEVVKLMGQLLRGGAKMIIISGTTYDKIAEGRLHEYFSKEELNNLYLGLGRGALNYSFTDGQPVLHKEFVPDMEERLSIHRSVFELHQYLLQEYGMDSDIVFTRPNYCKLDLMTTHDRNEKLFLQEGEIEMLQSILADHGIADGLPGVIKIAEQIGKSVGVRLKATTDAKYLEVGLTTKSDNVDYFVSHVLEPEDIRVKEVCFWGDEFAYLAEGVQGSDAYMITERTKEGHFFDVSGISAQLPEEVEAVGGGTESFLMFLEEQIGEYFSLTEN